MGLFDRKPKKDDAKAKKSQEEEDRMKKELETLQSILEKSDFKAEPGKPEPAPKAQERRRRYFQSSAGYLKVGRDARK